MMAEPPLDYETPAAILFDMDGVLFDSETLYKEQYFTLLHAAGHSASDANFAKLIGQGWQETASALAMDYPGLDGVDFVKRWKLACHPSQGARPLLKDGVNSLLDLLEARGVAAAIATGSQREVAFGFLEQHALRHRFSAIIAHEDTPSGKPHPDPFLYAAAAVDCEPRRCLVLEDSLNGLRAARAAGIPAVFVPDLIAPTDEIRRLALAVAPNLTAVRDWLDRLS